MYEIYTYFGRVVERVDTSNSIGIVAVEQARQRLLELERSTGHTHWMRRR